MTTITINKKITGFAVAGAGKQAAEPVATSAMPTPDKLPSLPAIAEGTLVFPKRPKSNNGFSAWTSDFIVDARRRKLALCISEETTPKGVRPFEVWALANEAPPVASLICQLLSQVMLTGDRGFVRYHLDALKKARGEKPFTIDLPHGGPLVEAPSLGAAIALFVEAHGRHLGFFDDQPGGNEEVSPMLSAMVSAREPKTTTAQYGPHYDVLNPYAGHDMPVFLKERWIEAEQTPVPISVWFGNGDLPEESQAILKLISLAMRHRDPAWIAAILRTLRKHVEIGAELGFASAGNLKPRNYGSTWAYVSDLVLSRYVELGVLDTDGNPVSQRSLFTQPEAAASATEVTAKRGPGRDCPACNGQGTVVRLDGCDCCTQCGASKCS